MQTATVSTSSAREVARTTEALLLEALRNAEAQIAELTRELETERRTTSGLLLQALEAAEAQIAHQAREIEQKDAQLEAERKYASGLAAENDTVSQENTSLRAQLAECRMAGVLGQ